MEKPFSIWYLVIAKISCWKYPPWQKFMLNPFLQIQLFWLFKFGILFSQKKLESRLHKFCKKKKKNTGGTWCYYLIDFHRSQPHFSLQIFITEISVVKCYVGNPERIKKLSSVSLSEGQTCGSASFHFDLEILQLSRNFLQKCKKRKNANSLLDDEGWTSKFLIF